MGSRRVFPLAVDVSTSDCAVRTQPPPPKTPLHRTPIGNDVARPPTGGSVGRSFMGFDRLVMMRQVNAATGISATMHTTGTEEVSAAVNHRQRMAAEQQRRMEMMLMSREDYIGTPEGQERLQRQEERSRMQEEELLILRLVEAERQAARVLQREKELEEERRVREQYLAKIRAQREQQEKEAREKEEKRKIEMEKKMKALKEAADAKARAEYAAKQSALEEEARLEREKHSIAVESVQMQIEDALGHGMQQEMIAERERQRQIAAEQEEWRAFQERELEKQREATQLRRAAMAQQYEQDKQRRLQIHKLQKERAAQQAERENVRNRQALEQQQQISVTSDSLAVAFADQLVASDRQQNHPEEGILGPKKDEEENIVVDDVTSGSSNDADNSKQEECHASHLEEIPEQDTPQSEPPQNGTSTDKDSSDQEVAVEGEHWPEKTSSSELEILQPSCATIDQSSYASEVSEEDSHLDDSVHSPEEHTSTNKPQSTALEIRESLRHENEEAVSSLEDENAAENKSHESTRPIWSICAAREKGFIPFAQILSVMENSPAMQATLQGGDLLIEFGGIVSSTPKCLVAIAECVQKNVNNTIPVGLLRSASPPAPADHFEEVRVSLCPRKWKGKGLLGCQLSPFKWPEESELPKKPTHSDIPVAVVEDTSKSDGGASALVVYEVVAGSIAEQAGFVNGDILAGFDDMTVEVSVGTIKAVVNHIRAARAAHKSVQFDIHRWVAEDQCYRSLRIVLPATASGPLGFSLTSFAEYYNYYSNTGSTASACGDCYYTSLTTALHAAALSGHLSCLKALLDSLLKQQEAADGGYTARDYLDWRDEDGRTPLFYACYAGQVECVQYLLKTTQSVTDKEHSVAGSSSDLYGDTVLHAATTSGSIAVIALVLDSGCVKVDERNHGHLTCAHVAPNVETLAFLGEQSQADLLATDAEERMPLAYACLRNDVDSIEYLCRKHPDFVDYADVRGNTPLHISAWMGFREASEMLLRYLPSIALYITNEDGQNAAEMARSSGMREVAGFLDGVIAADSNPP